MIYKITFYVDTPIICTTNLHLDALLSAVHPAMHNRDHFLTRLDNANSGVIVDAPLPIDSAKIGSNWIWACTAAMYPENAKTFTGKIAKRKTGIDYFYLNSRQTPRTGTGRDRCDSVYGVITDSIYFYASSNYEGMLNQLCRRVHSIGALRKCGYGHVKNYEIVEHDITWKDCLVSNNKAQRNIPKCFVISDTDKLVHCKAPFWIASNIVHGIEAGDNASLRDEVYLNVYKRN